MVWFSRLAGWRWSPIPPIPIPFFVVRVPVDLHFAYNEIACVPAVYDHDSNIQQVNEWLSFGLTESCCMAASVVLGSASLTIIALMRWRGVRNSACSGPPLCLQLPVTAGVTSFSYVLLLARNRWRRPKIVWFFPTHRLALLFNSSARSQAPATPQTQG